MFSRGCQSSFSHVVLLSGVLLSGVLGQWFLRFKMTQPLKSCALD